MRITFLGTASASASPTRSASCAALRLPSGDIWIVDAGENALQQLRRARGLRPGRVTRILITHLHGDHVFGLPSLLVGLSKAVSRPREREPIDVVGPRGLANFLRANLGFSASRVHRRFRVTELVPEPESKQFEYVGPEHPLHIDELPGCTGSTVAPLNGFAVEARRLRHGVLSLAFVITEPARPGKLHADYVLRERGLPPALVGQLVREGRVEHAGAVLEASDPRVMGPPTRGRRLVWCGDSCDSSALADTGADVFVHEATNLGDEARTVAHGHSTPQMAGRFAQLAGARKLVLTHFSARYAGDSPAMAEFEARARTEFEGEVVAARDFLEVELLESLS